MSFRRCCINGTFYGNESGDALKGYFMTQLFQLTLFGKYFLFYHRAQPCRNTIKSLRI